LSNKQSCGVTDIDCIYVNDTQRNVTRNNNPWIWSMVERSHSQQWVLT